MSHLRALATRRTALLLAALGAVAFIATRVIFLDWDVPAWTLTYYQPIDELFYAWPAFDLVEHGRWVWQVAPYVRNEAWPMNVAQNLVTWPMLLIFGDTLHGLRMSSVLAGAGISALTLLLVARVHRASAGEKAAVLGPVAFWGALLTADFAFLMATRVVEPTVFRMLGMVGALAIVTSPRLRREATRPGMPALVGFVATSAVVWFYLHNAFIVLACAIVVAWRVRPAGWRRVATAAAEYALGSLAAAASWAGFVYAVYRTGPLASLRYWVLDAYTGGDRDLIGQSILQLRQVLYTNIFRFDWALLFLLLVALPLAVREARRTLERDDVQAAVLAFLGSLALQTLVVNDYPLRKLVIVLPLAVLVLASAWASRDETRAWLRASARGRTGWCAWAALSFVGTAGLAALIAVPRFSGDVALPGITSALTAAGLLVAAACVVAIVRGSGARQVAAALLAALCFGSLWLDARYVFTSPTFAFRDVSASLAPAYDGKLVAGGWSFGMRLYNTAEPALSAYRIGDDEDCVDRTLARMVRDGRVSASFAYDNAATRERMARAGLRFDRSLPLVMPEGERMAVYVPER